MTDHTSPPPEVGTRLPERGSRQQFIAAAVGRHPGTIQVLGHFAWSHLPERLQQVSAPAGFMALEMVEQLPDGPELTAGLRKLLEAKDCFVRAAI